MKIVWQFDLFPVSATRKYRYCRLNSGAIVVQEELPVDRIAQKRVAQIA